jgi:hypothetical protein
MVSMYRVVSLGVTTGKGVENNKNVYACRSIDRETGCTGKSAKAGGPTAVHGGRCVHV